MGKLFIVAGASGAGKSYLLENMRYLDSSIIPVKKLSTRKPRKYETDEPKSFLDLVFNKSMQEICNCEYRYSYGKEWYGIQKKDINEHLSRNKNPVLIVRNCETIIKLKKDYPKSIVIYIQSGLSGHDLTCKLKELGHEDIELEERINRHNNDFHDYVTHLRYRIFDYVLVNYFDKNSFMEQLQFILQKEIFNEEFNPNLIFVLMSFNPEMNEIYDALTIASQGFKKKKLKIVRIDEKKGDYAITTEIIHCINTASLIICDLTEERPNVYFEVGYARGIGKRIIFCAKKGTKLHFDLKDMHVLFYNSPVDLQKKIQRELEYFFVSRPV